MTASDGAPAASPRKVAPYLFFGQTTSLCEVCYGLVPAKILIEGRNVFYQKRCRAHGVQKTLISDDVDYWKATKDWIKPGDRQDAMRASVRVSGPGTNQCLNP